jgi:uncharacterized protein (TIGR00290 family)
MWRARQSGMAIRRLITAMDESGTSSRSHGIPPQLLQAQADALDADMHFYETSWTSYEQRFISMLNAARADGITHAVFGDIDLLAHREWEEKVCARAGMQACLPLWDEPRDRLVAEFLALGFKAIVVCVNGNHLGEEFCGREFDAAFLADLPPGVDACGENGEFHTFVYDGPAFAKPVAFRQGQKLRYQAPAELGGATYHFQTLQPG